MHHNKFENNWSSGYQEGVKNIQMLTLTLYIILNGPALGAKPLS
jgi:hypothetical protein